MDNSHIEKLIIKQLSGETSVEENNILDKWLSASEENQKLFQFHKAVWHETALEYKNIDMDRVYDKISKNFLLPHENVKPINSWYRLKLPMYIRAAAVILLVVFGWVVWRSVGTKGEPNQQMVEGIIIEKEAAKGQKLKTFLPDGSVAWLNAETKITYNNFFSDSLRIVHLEGLAYFEVEKDSLRPFIVRSGEVDVIALGTAFSIRSYTGESVISVALEEGTVLVKMDVKNKLPERSIILNPGRQVDFNVMDHTFEEVSVEPDNAFNWKTGVLHFENASFDKVLEELSRWYGVEFEVMNNTRAPWRYTATFRNFNLKEVLQSMSYTKDFNYEIHHEKIIIYHNN